MNSKVIASLVVLISVVGCLGTPSTESATGETNVGERNMFIPYVLSTLPWPGGEDVGPRNTSLYDDDREFISAQSDIFVFSPLAPTQQTQTRYQGNMGGYGTIPYVLTLKVHSPGIDLFSRTKMGLLLLWRTPGDRIWRPFRCGDMRQGDAALPGNFRNGNANYFTSDAVINFQSGMVRTDNGEVALFEDGTGRNCGVGANYAGARGSVMPRGGNYEFGAYVFVRNNFGRMKGSWDYRLEAKCEGNGRNGDSCDATYLQGGYQTGFQGQGVQGDCIEIGNTCMQMQGGYRNPVSGGTQMGNQSGWGSQQGCDPGNVNCSLQACASYVNPRTGFLCSAGGQQQQQQQGGFLPQGCTRDAWNNPDCTNTACRQAQYCISRQQSGQQGRFINGEECYCEDEQGEYACADDGSCWARDASEDAYYSEDECDGEDSDGDGWDC